MTMTAADIIRLLDLKPHPEGGHYCETFRDSLFERDYKEAFKRESHDQYDLGKPSTCSARYDRIRLVETGAT